VDHAVPTHARAFVRGESISINQSIGTHEILLLLLLLFQLTCVLNNARVGDNIE